MIGNWSKLGLTIPAGALVVGLWVAPSWAAPISVPNNSFESPAVSFVNINLDFWQKSPKPDWYVEGGGIYWNQLTGAFKNTAPGSSDHIDNCDGSQAMWLFAVLEVALYQDYDTVDWNDPAPTHAFDATFEVGKSYRLAVGVLVGTAAGLPMQEGVTLGLSLYYRDAASNRVAVATTTVTNTSALFSNSTHLLDFVVSVPVVQPANPWAGRHIGIEFMSTVSSNMQGGYWDLDNVRLQEFSAPVLSPAAWENGRFQFSLRGEPGLQFEILATTNLTLPASSWTRLGIITNTTGEISFTDAEANVSGRFYRARQLP